MKFCAGDVVRYDVEQGEYLEKTALIISIGPDGKTCGLATRTGKNSGYVHFEQATLALLESWGAELVAVMDMSLLYGEEEFERMQEKRLQDISNELSELSNTVGMLKAGFGSDSLEQYVEKKIYYPEEN